MNNSVNNDIEININEFIEVNQGFIFKSVIYYAGKDDNCEDLFQEFKGFFPIHRLDKNTTGVLALAKTKVAANRFREQKEKNPQFVNSVLNSLDNISKKALEVLISKNLNDLGILMTEYYKELKK